jgi:hypothetical protein
LPPILYVLAIPSFFLLFALGAKIWERRLVWPYAPADVATSPTRYTTAASAAAGSLGFTAYGVYKDAKGALYRIRYELWLAPERDVLLLIGGGTLAGIPVNASWLFTRLGDGRCLATLDEQNGAEYDLAGLVDESVCPRMTLPQLLAAHRGRVFGSSVPALPYSDPVNDHRELLVRKVATLVQRGYASYWGDGGEGWRYTPLGALVSTGSSFTVGLTRGLKRQVTGQP